MSLLGHSKRLDNNMKKKSFIIVACVALVVLVGIFIWHGRHSKASTSNASATSLAADSGANVSLPSSVSFATLQGSFLRYADTSSSNFTSLDLASGKQQQFSPYLIDSQRMLWSSDGTKVLNVSGDDGTASVIGIDEKNGGAVDGGNMSSSLGVIHPLDSSIVTPTWSGDGKQILYQFVDSSSKKSTITVADADGSNWKSIVAAPAIFSNLWWSPLGTFAIGLDSTINPPQYDLIAISSKKVTKLAVGNGDLAWSPSGNLALLDSSDGKSLLTADVTAGTVTTIDLEASVRYFTWRNENTLVGINSGKVISVDLTTKKVQSLATAPAVVDEFVQVLGTYKKALLYQDGSAILSVPLNQ